MYVYKSVKSENMIYELIFFIGRKGCPIYSLYRGVMVDDKGACIFWGYSFERAWSIFPRTCPRSLLLDRGMALFSMHYLEPPHIILRKGLIAGVEYPLLAEHISDYMAKTLFHTSLLYLSTTEHKAEGMLYFPFQMLWLNISLLDHRKQSYIFLISNGMDCLGIGLVLE